MDRATALVLVATFLYPCTRVPRASAKYVLHVVADDLGYDDVGWRNHQAQTPTLDHLVAHGVEIPEFYTYMMCAPARGSTLSGRYPMRLGLYDNNQAEWDLDKAKLLPAVLKAGNSTTGRGWSAHALGKWHLGWYYKNYTATLRGFDTFYGSSGNTKDYWQHTSPKYQECSGTRPKDFIVAEGEELWVAASHVFGEYDAPLLAKRAMKIVRGHDLSQNLYIYLAFHNVHDPQEAPLATVERYPYTRDDGRKVSNAMLSELDTGVGNVTALMRSRGMWNDTLVIFHTDNGGATGHACNHPLRGGKFGFWEGGVRGVAFVGGGAVPSAVRGTQFDGLAHVSDWYATVAGFGGVQLPDDTGDAPLDSVDLWQALSTGSPSPRTEVLHMPDVPYIYGKECAAPVNASSPGSIKGCSPALRVGRYKLVLGWPGMDRVCADAPPSPTPVKYGLSGGRVKLGGHCVGGEWNPVWTNGSLDCVPLCLFDVVADPSETRDLSRQPAHASTLDSLQRRMRELSEEGAPRPAIQNRTRNGKNLAPQICANANRTGFYLPADWFSGSREVLIST